MKTLSRNVFISVVLAVIVVGAAYVLGHRRGDAQHDVDVATTTTHVENGHTAGPPSVVTTGPIDDPTKLSRDQAWEQMRAVLDDASVRGFPIGPFTKILSSTKSADHAFLLEQIANLPSGGMRDGALELLFPMLNGSDALKDISIIGLISDNKIRNDTTNRVLAVMIMWDANQAEDELAKLPRGQQTQSTYRSVFDLWAQSNGPQAAAAAFALPPGAERTQALVGATGGWANHDPQAVLDWAVSISSMDPAILDDVVATVGARNPPLAAQYINTLADASARNVAIQSIVRAWVHPLYPIARQYKDPTAALDWLDQVATGNTYDTNVEYVFSQLDPVTASVLVDKVTESDVREVVITRLVTVWGKSDPQAALAWLQSLPISDGAIRDPLIQQMATSINNVQP